MSIDPGSVALFASALSNSTRVSLCMALLDGRAWTLTELSKALDVPRSSASEHLTTLVEAGLVMEERHGRHRYVRIPSAPVAELIESIVAQSGSPILSRSLRAARVNRDLALARTCYDHLAGALGVALYEAMVRRRLLSETDGPRLTAAGKSLLAEVAGESATRSLGGRPLVRRCMDWTERRHHLAGHAGNALRESFFRRKWIIASSTPRALRLTDTGAAALRDVFDLDPTLWRRSWSAQGNSTH